MLSNFSAIRLYKFKKAMENSDSQSIHKNQKEVSKSIDPNPHRCHIF